MMARPPRTWDPDALGVLLASFEGLQAPPFLREALAEGLAGVILFGYNTPDAESARALAREIHALAPECLITIDEEGGDVTRLQAADGSGLPSAWALGAVDDVDLTRAVGRALGRLLAAVDVDLDLAPVLDVSTDPANPVIGTRAFGDDPDRVERHGRALTSGLREAGIGSCGKHFPGHGATRVDSHAALPSIDLPPEQLRREHLAPWHLAPWLDAVMTAHILVPALGEGPASIAGWSRPLLDRISGAGGFRGLVITDALDMAAVSADPGYAEAVVRALEAGADLLCLGTSIRRDDEDMLREAHDAILSAVAEGRISRADLAVRARRTRERIRALRARRRAAPAPDLAAALAEVERIGAIAARRAVTSRRSRLEGRTVCVLDARGGSSPVTGSRANRLVGILRRHGYDAHAAHYPADLREADDVLVLTRLPRTDPEEGASLRAALAERPDAIVVHAGVPDAAPDHPRRVLALGAGRAMLEAAVAELIPRGTAPAAAPLRGDGGR